MVDRRDSDDFVLLALLALAAGGVDDPYIFEFLRYLRHQGRFRELADPEFEMLFERAFRSRNRRSEELRSLVAQAIDGLRGALDDQGRQIAQGLIGLVSSNARVGSSPAPEFAEAAEQTHDLAISTATDLYDLTWMLSTGVDVSAAQIHRPVPVRLYFSQRVSPAARQRVVQALVQMLDPLGFELSAEMPDQSGSWWKRLVFRTKTVLSQQEVQKRLKKAEQAVQATYLDKPQAEANNLQASAAAGLIASLNDTHTACIQVGTLLVVKATNADGNCAVVARTLTADELRHIEENQSILRDPERILEYLQGREQEELS